MLALIVAIALASQGAHALCTKGDPGLPGPTPQVFQDGPNCLLVEGSNGNASMCHADVLSDRLDKTIVLDTANPFSVAVFNGTRGLTSVNLTDGQVLIGSTGAAAVPGLILGTTGQVVVTGGAGTLTLSTPQSIATTSSPTFAGVTLTGLSANGSLYTSNGKVVSSSHLMDGQILIGANIDVPIAASITGTANQVIVTNGKNSITLSTPQSIHVDAAPSFAAVSVTGATNQVIMGTGTTLTLNAPAPSVSRIVSFQDPGAAANVLYNVAAQSISGTKTFTVPVVLSATAGQLVMSGPSRTLTLSAVQPTGASRTVTIQDPGADCDVVLTASDQTIAGIKTFSATTDASSTTVAGTVVSGGLGVAKKLYVGTGIYLPTASGTASQLNYYEEYSGNLALGGALASIPTALAIKVVRIGSQVTLQHAALSASTGPTGTINSITTALPSTFRPSATLTFASLATITSATADGAIDIRSDGFIIWYASAASGNYSAGLATSGFPAQAHTYTVL